MCLSGAHVCISVVTLTAVIIHAVLDMMRSFLQSAAIAQQLESTHACLQEVSAQLSSLQQQIQQERLQHRQQIAQLTAETQLSTQQLQTKHEQQVQQLQEQQKDEVARMQLAERRLDSELADAKAQLAAALHDLEAERHTSGRLHEQVTRLHHEFADAREHYSSCGCAVVIVSLYQAGMI